MASKSDLNAKIYEYICGYQKDNGFAPSIRDIQAEFNFKSTSTVCYHLDRLQNDGLIKRNSGLNRAIIPQNKLAVFESFANAEFTRIPLIGDITAGQPILAEENYQETYCIPTSMFKGENLFMLSVHGDSMIDAGIHDGDKIIVKQQSTAENGEIVAALLETGATVKRFYKEESRFRLQPENPTMAPIYCDSVQILGKVIGLIRKF